MELIKKINQRLDSVDFKKLKDRVDFGVAGLVILGLIGSVKYAPTMEDPSAYVRGAAYSLIAMGLIRYVGIPVVEGIVKNRKSVKN
jgi:hypothetical protein